MNATANIAADFAKALDCKPAFIAVRLHAIGLADNCHRCGGSGHYSRNGMGSTTCYRCGGAKVEQPTLTAALLERAQAAVARGELEPYLAACRARAAAKATVRSAQDRVHAKLYGNALSNAIKAACAAKGKTHWSAANEIRGAALGLPAAEWFKNVTGSMAIENTIIAQAAAMLDEASRLNANDPAKVAAWEERFTAAEAEVAKLAAEGMAAFAAEPWWK